MGRSGRCCASTPVGCNRRPGSTSARASRTWCRTIPFLLPTWLVIGLTCIACSQEAPIVGPAPICPQPVPCDDGDPCTLGETRTGEGACQGQPRQCDDGNPCTDDGCRPGQGCIAGVREASCDDGNACTTADACQPGGMCLGKVKACNDANPCTLDACDPAAGCTGTAAPATVLCDLDGSQCTADHCQAGACVAGGPTGCEDGNPCTKDECVSGKCDNHMGDYAPTALCWTGRIRDRVRIPAGHFAMWRAQILSGGGGAMEKSAMMQMSSYWIDRYEVTVAKYALCRKAGACPPPGGVEKLKNCNDDFPDRSQHPQNCMTWDAASVYCKWVGGRLPSSAQWEKALRGGCENLTGMRCLELSNSGPHYLCDDIKTQGGCQCDNDHSECSKQLGWTNVSKFISSTTPVGSFPLGQTLYGVYDMGGNAYEWTRDWYDPAYSYASETVDPQGPLNSPTGKRLYRGGAPNWGEYNLQEGAPPDWSSHRHGLRCVWP